MGIQVMNPSGPAIWSPLVSSATVYVGGLVMVDTSAPTEGVLQLADAAGAANVTNKDVPLGVCIGTNRRSPLYSSTYKTDYITDPGAADAHDGASIEYALGDGPWAHGDQIAMVRIELIGPETWLKAPLYNAAVGTAPTEVTATNTSSDGLGITTGSIDFTADGNPLATIYCRSGANKGAYRILDSNSATVHTWDQAMRNDIAIGDTFVAAPLRPIGLSTIMFDATAANFIDVADAPVLAGTNRWIVHVRELNLETAGEEYAIFRFDAIHFAAYSTAAAA